MSLWLLLLLVCPVAMFLMMRGMGGEHEGHNQRSPAPTPLELLQARYARGEITQEEFEAARETLTRGPSAPVG